MEQNVIITAANLKEGTELELLALKKMGANAIRIDLVSSESDDSNSNIQIFSEEILLPLNLDELLINLKKADIIGELQLKTNNIIEKSTEIINRNDARDNVVISGISLNEINKYENILQNFDYEVVLLPNEVHFKELYFKHYCEEIITNVIDNGASGIYLNHSMVTRMLSDTANTMGVYISVTPPKNDMEIRHLLDLGIKRISTTNLRQLTQILDSYKKRYILA